MLIINSKLRKELLWWMTKSEQENKKINEQLNALDKKYEEYINDLRIEIDKLKTPSKFKLGDRVIIDNIHGEIVEINWHKFKYPEDIYTCLNIGWIYKVWCDDKKIMRYFQKDIILESEKKK